MTTFLGDDSVATIQSALEQDGFIILEQALAGRPIQEFAAGCAAMFAAHAQPGEDAFATCHRLGLEDKALLHRIYHYSRSAYFMNRMREFIFGFAKDLLPNKGMYLDIDTGTIFSLPSDERLTWRWHQESTYHPPEVDSLGFWFPIFAPATERNGTMSVLKGSHKLGIVEYKKHKPTPDAATSLIPAEIDEYTRRFEEVHCVCDVGDVVIFHKDLIHRSNLNRDVRPRITGLVRVGTTHKVPDSIEKVY